MLQAEEAAKKRAEEEAERRKRDEEVCCFLFDESCAGLFVGQHQINDEQRNFFLACFFFEEGSGHLILHLKLQQERWRRMSSNEKARRSMTSDAGMGWDGMA